MNALLAIIVDHFIKERNRIMSKKLVCTAKTCGVCSGASCALGTVVTDETPLEKICCPLQQAQIETAREEVSHD